VEVTQIIQSRVAVFETLLAIFFRLCHVLNQLENAAPINSSLLPIFFFCSTKVLEVFDIALMSGFLVVSFIECLAT
jgi:hypothetical protein